jgi:hypothetical protein
MLLRLAPTAAALSLAATAVAQVPNTFTAGTPAKAAEVNANFLYLDGRVTALATELAGGVTVSNTPANPVPVDVQNVVTVSVSGSRPISVSVVNPPLVPVSVRLAITGWGKVWATISLPSAAVLESLAATCPDNSLRAEQVGISLVGSPALPAGVSAVLYGYSGTLAAANMELAWPVTSTSGGAMLPLTKVQVPVGSSFVLWVGPEPQGSIGGFDCIATAFLRFNQ